MRHLILLASSLLPVLTSACPVARGRDSTFNPLVFPLHFPLQQAILPGINRANPLALPLQQATCPGINRAENNKTIELHLGMLPTVAFS
jgi:hypothetical protein